VEITKIDFSTKETIHVRARDGSREMSLTINGDVYHAIEDQIQQLKQTIMMIGISPDSDRWEMVWDWDNPIGIT
jgi:hypothetical protein